MDFLTLTTTNKNFKPRSTLAPSSGQTVQLNVTW